jgi:hypothetical protein
MNETDRIVDGQSWQFVFASLREIMVLTSHPENFSRKAAKNPSRFT